jgi:hypothetical protein
MGPIGKIGKGDRQGHILYVFQHYQGLKVFIPGTKKGENRQRRQAGTQQGQHNVEIDTKIRGPVYEGRFPKAVGDTFTELTAEEYAETGNHGGYYQGKKGVVQVKLVHDEEIRDHGGLEGNHHGSQNYPEQNISAGKSEFGKNKTRDGTGKENNKGNRYGYRNAVPKPSEKRSPFEYCGVTRQCPLNRQHPVGIPQKFLGFFEGVKKHPDIGHKHHKDKEYPKDNKEQMINMERSPPGHPNTPNRLC